jgi:hypothetical protein
MSTAQALDDFHVLDTLDCDSSVHWLGVFPRFSLSLSLSL